jgi:hypothetical protein
MPRTAHTVATTKALAKAVDPGEGKNPAHDPSSFVVRPSSIMEAT